MAVMFSYFLGITYKASQNSFVYGNHPLTCVLTLTENAYSNYDKALVSYIWKHLYFYTFIQYALFISSTHLNDSKFWILFKKLTKLNRSRILIRLL
jgi:hypothetical protein